MNVASQVNHLSPSEIHRYNISWAVDSHAPVEEFKLFFRRLPKEAANHGFNSNQLENQGSNGRVRGSGSQQYGERLQSLQHQSQQYRSSGSIIGVSSSSTRRFLSTFNHDLVKSSLFVGFEMVSMEKGDVLPQQCLSKGNHKINRRDKDLYGFFLIDLFSSLLF